MLYYISPCTSPVYYLAVEKPKKVKKEKTFCKWLKETKAKIKKSKKHTPKASLKQVEWDFNKWQTTYVYDVEY